MVWVQAVVSFVLMPGVDACDTVLNGEMCVRLRHVYTNIRQLQSSNLCSNAPRYVTSVECECLRLNQGSTCEADVVGRLNATCVSRLGNLNLESTPLLHAYTKHDHHNELYRIPCSREHVGAPK